MAHDDIKKTFQTRLKMYPTDAKYYRALAKELGLKESETYKLFSVMGAEELKHLLTIATPRDFKHFSDYHDDAFRFNLHTHTNASDGRISPEDWLDYMSAYADLTAQHIPADDKPFLTAAITDHDTTKGAVAALKALIRNPEKYKNLRIVLGCEFSTHYKDKTRLKAPLPFELIGYSINPFDKGINKILSALSQERIKALPKIIAGINRKIGTDSLCEKELLFATPLLRKGLSIYLPYGIYKYINYKLGEEAANRIREYIFTFDDTQGIKINQEPDNIFTALNRSGFGFLGIAHPARTLTGDSLAQDYIAACKAEGKDAGREIMLVLLSALKDKGLCAAEVNYQFQIGDLKEVYNAYQNGEPYSDPGNSTYLWAKTINDFIEQNGLLKTGGYDTHHYTLN